jgi:catechol 2,3-dioxygenase-like lactoylglutathione lyase family enzyme
MGIRRIIPNIASSEPERSREFYCDFLGLRLGMDLGFIATYVSPTNPTAQISILRSEGGSAASAAGTLSVSVEVEDVDRLHNDALARGYRIVYPLTDEPFGVRRFAVEDPNGVAINIMCRLPQPNAQPAGTDDQ